jgi:hypothetical protein
MEVCLSANNQIHLSTNGQVRFSAKRQFRFSANVQFRLSTNYQIRFSSNGPVYLVNQLIQYKQSQYQKIAFSEILSKSTCSNIPED